MNYYISLINILSAFLGSLYIIYFFRTVCDFRIPRSKKIVFIIVFGLINGVASTLLSSFAIKPIALTILSIVLITVLLKASIIQSFLAFSIYIIGLAVGNALIPILMNGQAVSLIQSDPYLLLAGNLFSNSIVFTVFVLINPVKKYIQMIASDKFLLALTAATILVLCTSFTLHFYARNSNMSNYLIIAAISISYCVFIILMWFNTLRRVVRDEDLKQQKFYNESLRSTLFELRRFRHDWVNNLTVIDSMIKMNKSKELRQYVSELIEHCAGNINTQIYDIKNAGLFGILSSKINLAYSKGISVNISVIGEIEDIPGIKISELCEVVGIFLDNAIEEAEYGDKIININIREGCSYIALSVSNSCTAPPDMQKINIDGYSSKGSGRGMGLAIAKKILEKYKNVLHITTFEDNIFTQTLEIANKKEF